MSKATEENKFMCTYKNNNKNKTNILSSSAPVIHFLNCSKAAKTMTLKFSDFQFVFINCFVKH